MTKQKINSYLFSYAGLRRNAGGGAPRVDPVEDELARGEHGRHCVVTGVLRDTGNEFCVRFDDGTTLWVHRRELEPTPSIPLGHGIL